MSISEKIDKALEINNDYPNQKDLDKSELIETVTTSASSDVELVIEDVKTDYEEDYEKVRNYLHDMMDIGKDSIEEITSIAAELETPWAYEVVSNLLKTNSNLAIELLKLHKFSSEISGKTPKKDTNVTNNNLFVGSTAELQKVLKSMEINNSE